MALELPPHTACCRLQYDEGMLEEWGSYLSDEERGELQRFSSEKRRREFLLGRAALRTLLARELGRSPAAIPLYQAHDGAPEVSDSDLQISLSHSHGWAAAVVSRRSVGIDMEYIRPRHDELYRHILHSDEMDMFEALPCTHHERQILCWTLKEAALKAIRPTRHLSLKDLRIECAYEDRRAAVRDAAAGSVWTVPFTRLDGFYLAVAHPADRS